MRAWIARENGSSDLFLVWLKIVVIEFSVLVSPAYAEVLESTNAYPVDCRYEGTDNVHSNDIALSKVEIFPSNDVFRPLLADPKQPQFFAAWQTTRIRTDNTSVNIGAVGFGETFGMG